MIVYDVWADWCPPCKRFGPIFEKVANKFPDIEFVKVEADEHPEFLNHYSINSIPMILIVEGGELIASHAGILSEANFEMFVSTAQQK